MASALSWSAASWNLGFQSGCDSSTSRVPMLAACWDTVDILVTSEDDKVEQPTVANNTTVAISENNLFIVLLVDLVCL